MSGARSGRRRPLLIDVHGYFAFAKIALVVLIVAIAFLGGFLTHIALGGHS